MRSKLGAFIHLDFLTVKPYFTLGNMLLYAATTILASAFSASTSTALGVGLMLGALFTGFPFALGEKAGMDALYTSLAVDRRTVVRGRYLFTLLIDAIVTIACLALSLLISFVMGLFNLGSNSVAAPPLDLLALLCGLFLLTQALQLPIYFKMPYSRAKMLSFIPFALLMVGFLGFSMLRNMLPALNAIVDAVLASPLTLPLAPVALILLVALSYKISLGWYRKREF